MIYSKDCFDKFGKPSQTNDCMELWDVPEHLEIGVLPNKVYCNKLLSGPLAIAFNNIIKGDLLDQVKTWDGCFNIRQIRGSAAMSLHSWGLAIDINASGNGLGQQPIISPELVQCFLDAGFDWGGNFKRLDGMHFQLAHF